MAIVTGMTAEKIEEITNDAIVSASIDTNTGILTLQQRDGGTVTVGNVDTEASALASVDKAYPVGSIFMSVIATDPATQLGVGSWLAWGTGRVPVGVDPTQTEFNEVQKTGGAKTHALSSAEMPMHSHSNTHTHAIDHDHAVFNTSSSGAHKHLAISEGSNEDGINNSVKRDGTGSGAAGYMVFDADGAHAHAIDVPWYTGSSGAASTSNTGSTGSGSAHNNLQPYITCYMWRRTA